MLNASISYSQEDDFDLESDDFDLLEDSSFDQLELDSEKTDNLILEDSSDLSDLEKNNVTKPSILIEGFSGNIIQNKLQQKMNPR